VRYSSGRPEGERASVQREDHRAGAGSRAIRVTVVWATPHVQDVVDVVLPAGSTAAAAILRSGFAAAYVLDVDRLDCSVDGRRARPTTVLADGNRVDLARPLEVDPKSIRRLRALARPLRPTVKPERRGRE
jgi:putative ubiquitin-RnfH superfamily antitoxin RatB of RatAB toxin-antitoxin module